MKLLIFFPTILGIVFSTIYMVKRVGPSGIIWPIAILFVPSYIIPKIGWRAVMPIIIIVLGFLGTVALASLLGVSPEDI